VSGWERHLEGVLAAYAEGWFPMGDPESGELAWYSPDPRTVFELGSFHVPRRLGRRVRSGRFVVTFDRAFGEVVAGCADPGREGAWISEEIAELFGVLHASGFAHSVEAWLDVGQMTPSRRDARRAEPVVREVEGRERFLAGGIYGLALGGLFSGEAMFSRPDLGGTDASKVALAKLAERLRDGGFTVFDVQFANPHLEQFGCVDVPRGEYLARVRDAVRSAAEWDAPDAELD